MASRHAFARLCEFMADGQWLEVESQGQELFIVGPAARAYWVASKADDVLVSHGESAGFGLFGRYLIARQLGASPEVDLGDDAAIVRVLADAGLEEHDARELLHALDAGSQKGDIDEFFDKLLSIKAKLTKATRGGSLLELILGRWSAQQLVLDGKLEYNELDADARDEHREASASKYIREIGTMFEKLRRRLEKLELMRVQDSTVNEATRAYLYGFSRSAVLLSAAAVERALVAHVSCTSDSNDDGLLKLLNWAKDKSILKGDQLAAGHFLRKLRNQVAHEGYDPTADEGAQALVQGRRLVNHLASPWGSSP